MKYARLALCLALALGGTAQAACSDADRAALEALDRAWTESAAKGDKAALERIYHADYMDLLPGSPSGKSDTIARMVASAGDNTGPAPVMDFYMIQCTGNSALITHRNTITWDDNGTARQWYGRSVHQLVKQDGRWQVTANASMPLEEHGVVAFLDLEWNRADLAADKAWFERMLADDYVGVSGRTGKLESKADTLAAVGKGKVTHAVTTDMEVRVDDDHAVVTGVYHVKGTDEQGKAFDRRSRYIDTFAKRDGRWQILTSQGTPIPD